MKNSDSLYEVVSGRKKLNFQETGPRKQGSLGRKGFLLDAL